jgi:PAS domain S-box-containing protein
VRGSVTSYGVALVALGAAVLLRWLLDPLMGDALPLVTLFGAVAAAVWVGGYRPAVVNTILGYAACAYLFIEPRGVLGVGSVADAVGFVAYLFTCALIIGFGEAMRVAQNRATERRELLRVTLRSIGDAVITTDVESRVTYLNAVAESLTGWSQRDALGQRLDTVFRILNEKTRQPVENPATKALRQGLVVGLANHTVLIRKDGVECPIDDSAAPIRNERGEISGCVLIFRDVTAQRRVEQDKAAQLLTARLLASIVESSDDAIVSKSLAGVIQSWNAAAERLFGYTAEQAVGRHISLVIPPDRIAEEDHIIASLTAGKRIEHFETERQRSDGRHIPVSLTVSPIKDDDGRVIGASKIVRDITDRKRVEAERERFVTLVENSTDFVGICDLNAIPIFVNRAGLEMVGLDSIEQARNTPVEEFFFPEDRHTVMREFFPEVLEKGHGEIEVRFRHFKTGEARWMAYKLLVLNDAAGRPSGLATVSQDVTEHKRLEDNLRELAADLSEGDRRKDEFLATLAHELRNPLAPLCNMLEVLKRADDEETRLRARDTMDRQLAQLVRLVDDLLDLNRITHNRLELRQGQVELSTIIQQAVEASRPLADSAGHELRVTLPDEPLYAYADPARLAQVFDNLLNNSCKYTDPGGEIRVTAERDGHEVVVSVRDTGRGIPADKLNTIFDMFMQVDRALERSQGGLGIGLTLVKRLVEMHGGSIEARSAGEGQGSEFVVRLPMLVGAVEPVAPVPAAKPSLPQTRRILVVDDNSDAAVSLAMLLQIAGNDTYTAHDGPGAIESVERCRPEVILLDIGLPGLSGHEVCRRVRERPGGGDIVIIALTGWGQDADRRKSQEAGFDGHLVKPVDYDALMELLNSVTPAASRMTPSAKS